MTRQLIQKIIGVTGILTGFATIFSCEPDDICEPDNAPAVSVKMFYIDTNVELEDTIFYKAYINDSVLIGEGNSNNKSTFNLPIQIAENRSIKYILQQGSDYKINQLIDGEYVKVDKIAPKDTLEIKYLIDNKFSSKACGFGIYYKDASFSLLSNKWIKNIETVNNNIDNATTTNLHIFAEPRSY